MRSALFPHSFAVDLLELIDKTKDVTLRELRKPLLQFDCIHSLQTKSKVTAKQVVLKYDEPDRDRAQHKPTITLKQSVYLHRIMSRDQ